MTPFHERIKKSLEDRNKNGLLRRTAQPDSSCSIDLSTNSYLALHENEPVLKAAHSLLDENLSGNTASRLISTRSSLYDQLENELAQWKETECALVFNSGYAANVGILQALCSRNTEVFCDRLNHASIIDGILLSGAKLNRYNHRDMNDLKKRLSKSITDEKLIVTDTIFSMDGDRAPLTDICELAKKHNALIMVDEAHATGIFGQTQSGLVEHDGVADLIDIRMGTLSKAVAGLGGFFAGTCEVRDYLVNHARSLIYSTALPHCVLAYNLASVKYIRENRSLGKDLLNKANRFRNLLHESGFKTLNADTQILPCFLGESSIAVSLSDFLRKRGIKAPAIRQPTVPQGTARVRFSIHLNFGDDQMDHVIKAIKEWAIMQGTRK